jgi:hypothetical protein
MTLEERILLECKHYWETRGGHLGGATICTGSRHRDGSVPVVRWLPDEKILEILWYFPNKRKRSIPFDISCFIVFEASMEL